MDSLTKTVNFIMVHLLKHKQFFSILEEFHGEYSGLVMYAKS